MQVRHPTLPGEGWGILLKSDKCNSMATAQRVGAVLEIAKCKEGEGGALAFRLAYTPRRADGLSIHLLQLSATIMSSFLVINLDVWVPQEMQAVHANKVYHSPKTLF